MFSFIVMKSGDCGCVRYVYAHEEGEGKGCCAERAVFAPESDQET